jgi:glycine/D-amino acid oxidase-like deaminating enzyme
MTAAYPLWRNLETTTGLSLVEKMGGLYFGPRGHERLASAEKGMHAVGASPPVLDAKELRDRYPAFQFDADEMGLVDDEAGCLRASRCVRAAIACAVNAGAKLQVESRVARVEPTSSGVELRMSERERVAFDKAVVCAGSWTNGLLPELALPIRPTRQQYVHLQPVRFSDAFSVGAMPIWIDAAANWYGFPVHGDVAGAKIASHEFGETVDPDTVNRDVDDVIVEKTRDYARRRLPALADGEVTYAKVCLYTVTPDEDFIFDAVPNVPGCIFFTGCSGHAFKFGTLLGAVAADLTLDREPRVDISRFRLGRFRF